MLINYYDGTKIFYSIVNFLIFSQRTKLRVLMPVSNLCLNRYELAEYQPANPIETTLQNFVWDMQALQWL